MLLGVDYYPEQWDSALMESDMDIMLEMGCNVIRIAEFSWHLSLIHISEPTRPY